MNNKKKKFLITIEEGDKLSEIWKRINCGTWETELLEKLKHCKQEEASSSIIHNVDGKERGWTILLNSTCILSRFFSQFSFLLHPLRIVDCL